MELAKTTFEIVSINVVTLTNLVFSLTIWSAFLALSEPLLIGEFREKGRSVRYVASMREDQKAMTAATMREM
jgi:hypothetical protein